MPVLIAGAGPTGLTLAIELARRDVEVCIVDRSTALRRLPRGRDPAAHPGGVRRPGRARRGAGRGRAAGTCAGAPRGEFVQERWMALPREPTPAVPYPNPWMLGQSQTEKILRDRLAEFGAHVELATGVVSFEQDADGVSTTLSTGEVVRSAYPMGADGGRRVVRKALGIPFEGATDESIRMLLGDVAAELDPAYGYWFANELDPRSGVVLSPLPGTDLFQFGAPLTEDDSSASLETLQAKLDERGAGVRSPGSRGRPCGAPMSGSPNGSGPRGSSSPGTRHTCTRRPAARASTPACRTRTTWAGSSPTDPRELLDSYEAERREVAARVLGVSSGIMRKYAEGADDAHERGEDTLQLDISYRTSAGKLVAGDRAPDAPLVDANGKALRLFDLFRGPHATKLVFGADAPEEPNAYAVLRSGQTASGAYVVDERGHAFDAYDASDATSVLVRLDGYLSSRAEPR